MSPQREYGVLIIWSKHLLSLKRNIREMIYRIKRCISAYGYL